jgi:3-hydroxypropanoate dehydrogenase
MPLDSAGLDITFRTARTLRAWAPRAVSIETLHAIYELMKWGPTSGNCCPARIVFVTTPEGKERLKPALDPGNVAQTMAAPATAIIAYDLEFYELPAHFRIATRKRLRRQPDLIRYEAMRADAAGLSHHRRAPLVCGRGGFDHDKVDADSSGIVKSNFLCNLGYGDPSSCARVHRGLRSRTPAGA